MALPPERLTIRKQIELTCQKYARWNQLAREVRETFIRRIERNCFEVTIDECIRDGIDRLFSNTRFVQRYSTHCSRVISNLDTGGSVSNDYLLSSLLDGTIDSYGIATLSCAELFPQASQQERDDIARRQNQKVAVKVSYAFVCKKCGANGTIPINYQGRAADEADTWARKCIECEHIWR